VYDSEKIIAQFNRLTSAFSGTVKKLQLNYAAKGLGSNVTMLKLMNSLGKRIRYGF